MGCVCAKGSATKDDAVDNEGGRRGESNRSSVQAAAPSGGEVVRAVACTSEGCVLPKRKPGPQSGLHHRKGSTKDSGVKGVLLSSVPGIVSMPHAAKGEQSAAGWPYWLSSVAAEAIQGWVPRSSESYMEIEQIGQGTYSTVFRARDITNDEIVALKKVKFVNVDPESVRFMAREICILRRLDHPNVLKLKAMAISRISGHLSLVFGYMEHDLSGLATAHGSKFTEPQIKCYMQQLLLGLEHCHGRGVLHRDIKGANLLVDYNGVLKIGDFGLANYFQPDQKQQPLTSRVVTLWYRAPELLLGATAYGVAIDMWSVGCIIAELFAGKPIMPGTTEVEQMHKIFKLCGSPSEEYWQNSRLPHATTFRPQKPYRRRITETFKDVPRSALALIDTLLSVEPDKRGTAASALNSKFFTTKPLPSDPSTLPKYPPSKEFDARIKDEARSKKCGSVKGGEFLRKTSRGSKITPMKLASQERQRQSNKSISIRYGEDGGEGFPIEQPPRKYRNGISHSISVIHPNAASNYTWNQKPQGGSGQTSQMAPHVSLLSRDGRRSSRDSKGTRNRILYSGPLVPGAGSMEEMLKEHERHIQQAVRKARIDKVQRK
ncbi:probable serine/threonine-protein kinase At1g09600 isoform X1 [Ipomoea triloba]|uniref:probable serine/threonine-protein kinase At1g09600 isoform X1 n=1 Tax=Ipomoea triloba TaxID=35885 RepID=UPI00125E351E|nr:probable serine/threonine-protein kinase At1g09600 isoform X1 [Ipomoea triloba]XP_031122108.1 probable serine/threonine-protein kinase At1g09600 isoform X1 [Ipomoea triloba]